MAASDATFVPRRNTAYRCYFPILDADGDLVTAAAALDSEVSKDGGTFADATNEATEIATSSGMYFLDLTATEMDADAVCVIVKTSTVGAKTTPIILYTATRDIDDLATAAALTTVDDFLDTEIAAILAAVDTEVAAIKAKTDNLPAAPAATGDIPTAAAIADAVLDDSLTELAAVPAAAPTVRQALQYLFMLGRNKLTTTSTQMKVHNDAGTAVATATVSDDGTTFERSEFA